jgi:hypothetical protein
VSLTEVAEQAQAAVARMRALFVAPLQPPPLAAGLETAARELSGAGQHAAVLSGHLVDRHQDFVGEATRELTSDGHTDTALNQRLTAAATVTQAGARQLDAIAAQTRTIAQAAATAGTPAAQRAVLQALRTQVSEANSVVTSTRQQARALAGEIRALDYRSGGQAQAVGLGGDPPIDRSPEAPADPPHGRDPRYWVDVTKIIRVPDGQLPPYGSKQIGPGLWYPFDDGQLSSGPSPAKYPLDISRITTLSPGELGPYGTTELAPGVFAPDPRQTYSPGPSWPSPQQPVDIRDIIAVPKGQLAPWNYVEYLPGWYVPRAPNPR